MNRSSACGRALQAADCRNQRRSNQQRREPAIAVTEEQITFQGLLGPFDNSTLIIQLRHDGALWWARALWDENNAGGGSTKIGNLAIELRNADGETWTTARVIALYADSGSSVWTDETYNPTNGRAVRARFLATVAVSSQYPTTQRTPSQPT